MSEVFNTYEELMAAVEDRRGDTLTLAIDMGATYSAEYEAARQELVQAKALKSLAGEQQFLSDNIAALETKMEKLKPESKVVYAKFSRVSLNDWTSLMKKNSLTPIDQYEIVLPKTFLGLFGDPEKEAISVDFSLLSSKSEKCILSGGSLNQVIQAFMSWQNSGTDVTIHPTKSGQD